MKGRRPITPRTLYGRRLRRLRTMSNLRLKDVKERMGLDSGYLSQVETGKRPPLTATREAQYLAAIGRPNAGEGLLEARKVDAICEIVGRRDEAFQVFACQVVRACAETTGSKIWIDLIAALKALRR